MRKLIMAAALAVVLGAGAAPPAQAFPNIPIITPLTQGQIDTRQLYTIGKVMKNLPLTAVQLANGNQTLPVALAYITAHKPAITKHIQFIDFMLTPAGCKKTFIEGEQGSFGFASLAALNTAQASIKTILLCTNVVPANAQRLNFLKMVRLNPLGLTYNAQIMIASGYPVSGIMFADRDIILDIIFTPPSVDIFWPGPNPN